MGSGRYWMEKKLKISWFQVLIALLVCAGYFFYFVNRAHVDLQIQVEKRTFFKIYWVGPGERYSEKHHVEVLVKPGREQYRFYLTDLEKVSRLRIDPQEYRGVSRIKKIEITQNGFPAISLGGNSGFSGLQPGPQVQEAVPVENMLEVRSSGNDPFFEYTLPGGRIESNRTIILIRLGAIFLFVCLGGMFTGPLLEEYRFVPMLLVAAITMAIVMAGTSRRDVHPDEHVHLEASKYFMDNWMPPRIEDEKIRNTYSRYGVSRLNNHEVYYFFAGKFASLFSDLKLDDYKILRAFNILLFISILLVTIIYTESRLVALPLLLSSQVWYLFSYCNSDAFSLFIAFIAAWQLTGSETLLKRFLTERPRWKTFGYGLVIGLFFGLVLLLKKNYYPFVFFLIGALLFFCWSRRHELNPKRFFIRLTAILLIGGIFAGARVYLDYKVNGPERDAKIMAMRVKLTEPLFNPTTDLNKQYAYLRMKERGVTLTTIINVHRWCEKSFRSAFGVFGYSTISATHVFYDNLRWLLLGFFLFVSANLLFWGDWRIRAVYLWGLLLSLALIGASIYHSWTVDFQAQGRYLFPILPILGSVLVCSRDILYRKGLSILVFSIFLMGCYSFIAVGLGEIPGTGTL